ncbi:MAG: bifunctional riboflavin kinase/FAD synthetase [Pirellulales bacterium]|nr:bifunctional riboflavin kinase/FAD synthetase [Pirellulales bacterium]
MQLIRHLDELPDSARGGAVTIGNFDGVHRGHVRIVERLIQKARAIGGPAVVLTFDPHPVRLLRPEACPPPLTWTQRKADLLAACGIDWMIAYPTDIELLQLSARQFFFHIIQDTLRAKAIVEGSNFFFGHHREGNPELLRDWGAQATIQVDIVEAVWMDHSVVSSSRIRDLIAQGHVATASAMLSAPYRVRGMVTHGTGRGMKLGYPTANLVGIDTLVPAPGVYAGRGWLGDTPWPAATHIGPNPTFGETGLKVEVHLIGYRDPLYGQIVEVDFNERLRDIQPFASSEDLIAQLQHDVAQVLAVVPKT